MTSDPALGAIPLLGFIRLNPNRNSWKRSMLGAQMDQHLCVRAEAELLRLRILEMALAACVCVDDALI